MMMGEEVCMWMKLEEDVRMRMEEEVTLRMKDEVKRMEDEVRMRMEDEDHGSNMYSRRGGADMTGEGERKEVDVSRE
ncbi:hypothetical protein Pcinc_039945 [Petrolisthes cinctipes]|uniref:Uncharacterized protein n=1 Tax=Petrolisthes cinctipes TaxID=88211 RepID=A0AAE1BMK4_PETCI|nr:hypothetical protein Pcinc_039945 [Petrolisthes cinctipes]